MIWKLILFFAVSYGYDKLIKNKKSSEEKDREKDGDSKFSKEFKSLKRDLKNEYDYYKRDRKDNYNKEEKKEKFSLIKNISDGVKKEINPDDQNKNRKNNKKKKQAKSKVKDLVDEVKIDKEKEVKEILNKTEKSFEDDFLKTEDFQADKLVKSIIIKEILDKPLSMRDEF